MSSQYEPPIWAVKPTYPFTLEVFKDGKSIDTIDIGKLDHYIVGCASLEPILINAGRLESCDVYLQHQTISRQHAVLQHRDNGMRLRAPFG